MGIVLRVMVVLSVVIVACGDERVRGGDTGMPPGDSGSPPDADVGVVDSSVDSRADTSIPPADSAVADTAVADTSVPGECSGPAVSTVGGVLTAYPGITYAAEAGFALRSVNFVEDGTRIDVIVEVENTGAPECDFFPRMTLDGISLFPGNVVTPPHYTSIVGTVTNDCLSTGDVGVVMGSSRTLALSDLGSGSFFLEMSPSTIGTPSRATNGPTILSATPAMIGGEWGVNGQIRPMVTIRNYLMTVYARDSRGLLIAELLAAPGTLGTLTGGATIDFATDTTPCGFADMVSYQAWIVE